jgi:hypothetical protein
VGSILLVTCLSLFVVSMTAARSTAPPTLSSTTAHDQARIGHWVRGTDVAPAEQWRAMPLLGSNPVTGSGAWWSWALLDRRTGQAWGSPTADEETRSVSMIKFWLAALYLREHPNPPAAMRNSLSSMIRDSNNDVADSVFFGLGGREPVVAAMKSLCGVTEAYIPPGYWWASTWISSLEVARLGGCVADGKVADPQWTEWVLEEMRMVRGNGNFGIRFAFPEPVRSSIAIKNGWNVEEKVWFVNCLAIGDTWVLAVQTRSPSAVAGVDNCVSVPRQLLQAPPAGSG